VRFLRQFFKRPACENSILNHSCKNLGYSFDHYLMVKISDGMIMPDFIFLRNLSISCTTLGYLTLRKVMLALLPLMDGNHLAYVVINYVNPTNQQSLASRPYSRSSCERVEGRGERSRQHWEEGEWGYNAIPWMESFLTCWGIPRLGALPWSRRVRLGTPHRSGPGQGLPLEWVELGCGGSSQLKYSPKDSCGTNVTVSSVPMNSN
jgi:hypothetical protein